MYPFLEIGSKSISTYNLMYLVGIIGMFVICLLSRKKYKTNLPRAFVYTLVTFVFGVVGAMIMGKIFIASMSAASGGEYIPDSNVCIFGALMFLPVFMIVLSLISGEKYRKLMDYMTPGIFFILACAKFGCLLAGCCYGVASEHGVYNHNLDYLVFPVQLYESLCTLVLVAVLIAIMCKRGKVRYGALYPVGTILYCCTRFVWEEFRNHDHVVEKEFFLSLTYWQCWAIIAIIISLIWLIVLYARPEFKECALEPRIDYEGMLKSVVDKITAKHKKNKKSNTVNHSKNAKKRSKKKKR